MFFKGIAGPWPSLNFHAVPVPSFFHAPFGSLPQFFFQDFRAILVDFLYDSMSFVGALAFLRALFVC